MWYTHHEIAAHAETHALKWQHLTRCFGLREVKQALRYICPATGPATQAMACCECWITSFCVGCSQHPHSLWGCWTTTAAWASARTAASARCGTHVRSTSPSRSSDASSTSGVVSAPSSSSRSWVSAGASDRIVAGAQPRTLTVWWAMAEVCMNVCGGAACAPLLACRKHDVSSLSSRRTGEDAGRQRTIACHGA